MSSSKAQVAKLLENVDCWDASVAVEPHLNEELLPRQIAAIPPIISIDQVAQLNVGQQAMASSIGEQLFQVYMFGGSPDERARAVATCVPRADTSWVDSWSIPEPGRGWIRYITHLMATTGYSMVWEVTAAWMLAGVRPLTYQRKGTHNLHWTGTDREGRGRTVTWIRMSRACEDTLQRLSDAWQMLNLAVAQPEIVDQFHFAHRDLARVVESFANP
jgi:hypothetical protein